MQITLQQKNLNSELQLMQGIIEKKTTSPILGHVLMIAEKESVKLLATDLEVWMKTTVPCQTSESGALLVPAKKLFEVVRSLSGAEVTMKGTENFWLNITCETSEFNLAGLPPEDFPSIPDIDFESGYSIPQNELFELIKRVVIAMTQEEGRFFINGALLQRVADGLVMVATDGHRLAYYKKKMDFTEKKEEKKAELKTVVAKKVLSELLKIIDVKSVDPVIFDVKGNFIYFYIAPRLLVARLLEASFPNYKEAIEIDLDKKMIIPRINLSNAVRRVSLFANERAKGITLKFSENSIDLASRSPELGNASEKIGCQYNDEIFKVGFNADYLLDFLNVVDDEEVIAEFRTVNKRAVFRQTKESIDEYRYVVMPMDVGEEEL